MVSLFDLQSYQSSLSAALTLLTALAALSVGLWALARERGSAVSLTFFLVTLSVAAWLATRAIIYSATDEHIALWWARAEFMSLPFVAPAIYHFSVGVLGLHKRPRKVVWTGWGLALFFSAAGVSSNAMVEGVSRYQGGYYSNFGVLGLPFAIFFFGLLVGSMLQYWGEYRVADEGVRKASIKWLLIALGVGCLSVLDFAPVYGLAGYPLGYAAILGFIVVTATTIRRLRLVSREAAFTANDIASTMGDALLIVDAEGVVKLANKAAGEIFGVSVEELTGKMVTAVTGDGHFADRLQAIIEVGLTQSYELDYRPGGRKQRVLSLTTSVIRSQPAATLCIARDITLSKQAEREAMLLKEELEQRVADRTLQLQEVHRELWNELTRRRQVEQALRELATHDELTKLHNRREMKLSLAGEIRRSLRYKRPFSLVMLDIDHFTQVNEKYGQQVGDEVLRWVAGMLIEKMRSTDRVARYGGEEMAILLPETTYVEAYQVAEDLRLLVAGHLFVFPRSSGEISPFSVTVSLGVAELTKDIASVDALIEAADLALTDAKAQGRNCTVHYYPETARLDISGGEHQQPFL